jgi:hypothetical protein
VLASCKFVNDTPAFEAEILIGDIVVAVNNRQGSYPEAFGDMLQNIAGQCSVLSLRAFRLNPNRSNT